MVLKLSIKEARKITLHSQNIFAQGSLGKGISATQKTIQHLGYIQIDTISVIERAHHHTLWNRVENYQSQHIEKLQKSAKIFEYWTHALAYLPIEDFRFCLPQMRRIASGEKHWHDKDPELTAKIFARIKEEGPLRTGDFNDIPGESNSFWERKPAKIALEQLFIEGELMIAYREKFQKVYDLTERVLPSNVSTKIPSSEEFARFLITRFLKAHGLGKVEEIAYRRKGAAPIIRQVLRQMEEDSEVIVVDVKGEKYYGMSASLKLLEKPIKLKKLKILSPFDNLVIQRKRLNALFDYEYLIECYVPKNKRKFGYFSLPLLWNGSFVGSIDLKASRSDSILMIQNLVLESTLKKVGDFIQDLVSELKRFAQFNKCDHLMVNKTSKPKITQEIKKVWNSIE